MVKVFISYRRADTSGYSGRLYHDLKERIGGEIFMDIDSIPAAADFIEVIESYVSSCDVLIALIGRNWLKVTDKSGNRRLDDAKDFVRLEISTALKGGKIVVPILVQGAEMPLKDDLPEDLQPITRRNAVDISDHRWYYDLDRLVEVVKAEYVEGGLVRATLKSTLEKMQAVT